MSEPLPPEILVQQADGTKAKAVLLQWPVNDLPVYAVEILHRTLSESDINCLAKALEPIPTKP
jgi:hypothetical protein